VTRGLVIGKFYPPHRGHSFLIETALAHSDSLVVLVCEHPSQTIHAQLRAGWLREMHPSADVRVIEDIGFDDDSKIWADYTKSILGWDPDIVFTSENYGDPYARFLGCRHFPVDKTRRHVPVSGTQIRLNPLANWSYLDPPVRAYFACRVCVLGAESTGTTTMARALAGHYQTVWVPEFGRTYSEGKYTSPDSSCWESSEFVFIAETQNRFEDQLARLCNKLLICDTNCLATELWHERYLGSILPELAALTRARRYDLYLLTGDEIPFVQDGLRDGEHIRHSMHERFLAELTKHSVPYILLEGSHERRLKTAIAACDALLNPASLT
jgi:HTH-type transcriptional repressor of NAD biosynthesis genes